MATNYLIDTGVIFAMVVKEDENRDAGLRFATEIRQGSIKPIVTDYIVDELLTLVLNKKGIKIARIVRDFIKSRHFKIHQINQSEFDETLALFFHYNSKKGNISFTDCSNCVVSRELEIKYIASFDSDHDVFHNVGIHRIGDPSWVN
jgi:predicted nucleic acid-binding protein